LDKNTPFLDKKTLIFCPFSDKVLSVNGQKKGLKMTEVDIKNTIIIGQKQGIPVYSSNPSVPDPDSIKKRKAVRFASNEVYLLFLCKYFCYFL
jgi:hypothetical protein